MPSSSRHCGGTWLAAPAAPLPPSGAARISSARAAIAACPCLPQHSCANMRRGRSAERGHRTPEGF